MASPCDAELDARGVRPQELIAHITSCWRTQALHVAAQLELPDLLSGGPREVRSLAAQCGSSGDGLQRLLRALCTLDVCRDLGDGRFELTETGNLLRRHPAGDRVSLRAMALWWGSAAMWPMWGDLSYSVRTGESARARQCGRGNYAFLDDSPERADLFHDTMRAMTALIAGEVAGLEAWKEANELVDVGGGSGELAAAIAASHPALRVTVIDRPDAAAGALASFEHHGVARRARFVAGDFFASIPRGADRYVLKSILHNWDDAACRRILARCAEAAPPGARLLIVERVRPERLRPSRRDEALARTDLNMLAGLGGRERSLSEFEALLAAAGFQARGCTRMRHEFSVLDAVRV